MFIILRTFADRRTPIYETHGGFWVICYSGCVYFYLI